MEMYEWLGELVGGTLHQSAFYRTFFKELLENGFVYASDMAKWGWHRRSVELWRRRLVDLEIIEQKREGWKGKVFYKWHPQFYANLVKLVKIIKKQV